MIFKQQKNANNVNYKQKHFKLGLVVGLLLVFSVLITAGIVFRDKIWSQSNSSENTGKNIFVYTGENVKKLIKTADEKIELVEATLTFSKKSIISPKEIDAYSITEVRGLYEGSKFITGIHVKSDDELMAAPAILTFDIPEDIPTDEIMGFAYDDDGKDLHLYPIEIKDQQAIMKVTHFSGFGLIQITGFNLAPPEPSNLGNVVMHQVAQILYQERRRQALGEDDENIDHEEQLIKNLFMQWMNIIIKNYVNPAIQDPRLLNKAVIEFQSWQIRAGHFLDDAEYNQEEQRFIKAINNAITKGAEEASEKCIDDHDPVQAFVLQEIHKVNQVLNKLGLTDDKKWILDAAKECASFRLTISTIITQTNDNSCPSDIESYQAEIPIVFNEDFTLSGEGEIVGEKEVCGTPCTVESGTMGQRISIPNTKLISGGEDKIELLLEVFDYEQDTVLDCSHYVEDPGYTMGLGSTNIYRWWLTDFFDSLEIVAATRQGSTVKIEGWEIMKKDNILAQKTYTSHPFGDEEVTTLKLIHSP